MMKQSLWMVFAAFAFSIMGLCVKLGAEQYNVGEITFYRSLLGVLITWVLLRRAGLPVATAHLWAHVKRSSLGVISLMLWFVAIADLPLAMATTLNYMAPVWIALMAAYAALRWRSTRYDWKAAVAVLVSFVGVVCLLKPTVQEGQLSSALIGLLSGWFTAWAYLAMRQLALLKEPVTRIVFYFSATGALFGLCWMLTTGMHAHTWYGAGLLITIGLSATIGQAALTAAFKSGNTLLTANLQYVGIVFAIGWQILFWREWPDWLGWSGMALIVVSAVAATAWGREDIPVRRS